MARLHLSGLIYFVKMSHLKRWERREPISVVALANVLMVVVVKLHLFQVRAGSRSKAGGALSPGTVLMYASFILSVVRAAGPYHQYLSVDVLSYLFGLHSSNKGY